MSSGKDQCKQSNKLESLGSSHKCVDLVQSFGNELENLRLSHKCVDFVQSLGNKLESLGTSHKLWTQL